jgi:hypothetical protein
VDEGTKAGGQVRVWEQKGGWAVVCKELLGKLLKNKRVWPFENPVDPKALKLGDYKKIVKKPMDLGTVGAKLEEGKYNDLEQSGEEFYKDVVLTFDNALLYNPEGDEIWEHAASLKATFEELWAKVLEPAKGGQAAVSSKAGTPGGADRGAVAKSDAASQSWQEWAAGMVRKMVKAGYSKGLREPMDAKAMGLSDYKKKVKEPMDLGTVESKLLGKEYGTLTAFVEDVRLAAVNAVQYFDDEHALHKQALKLLDVFEEELQAFQRRTQDVRPKVKTPICEHKGEETPGGAGEGALKNGQECPLGTQVRMLFDDGVWYAGTVTKFDARSKKYTIEFDDGEVQETKIPDDDVQLVPLRKGSSSSSKGAGKRAQSETSAEDAPATAAKTPSGSEDTLKPGQEYALGTNVRMLFDDGVWHPGTIVKFDGRSQKYSVQFEDGDSQETKIPDQDVEVVQGHAASAGAGKAAKRARTSPPDEAETESKHSIKTTSKGSAKGRAVEDARDADVDRAPAWRGKSAGKSGGAAPCGAGEDAASAPASDMAAASAGAKRSVSVRESGRCVCAQICTEEQRRAGSLPLRGRADLLRKCACMPANALHDAQSRKRLSEGETELHEDPEANIGREVSYRSDSCCSKVSPQTSHPSLSSRCSLNPKPSTLNPNP